VSDIGRRIGPAGAAIAAGAVLLFVYALRAAGTAAVIEGVRRLGAGFLVVLALGGVRHVVRTWAWWLCLEPRERLPIPVMFAAYLAGDALGNVTPFGFLISEPSKIVLVRERIDARASISALAIENLLYLSTVVVMLAAGTIALLAAFPLPPRLRDASLATLLVTIAAAALAAWIVVTRRPVLTNIAAKSARWPTLARRLQSKSQHLREIETRVLGFASLHRGRALLILVLEVVYHASAVAEIWFALGLITGRAPAVLTAFVLEYVNRTITIVFQFVPMWIGVDEAGTGLMTTALGLGAASGVALALVRKARVAAWTALGLVFLFAHGLSPKSAARHAEALASDSAHNRAKAGSR